MGQLKLNGKNQSTICFPMCKYCYYSVLIHRWSACSSMQEIRKRNKNADPRIEIRFWYPQENESMVGKNKTNFKFMSNESFIYTKLQNFLSKEPNGALQYWCRNEKVQKKDYC